MNLAPMRRRHLPAVLRIEYQVHPRPWTVTLFAGELAQRDSRHYVVARVEDQVVGYGGVMFGFEEAHITTIAVDPAWQRRGIGRALLADLLEAAVERTCPAVTLEVRASNATAQALYRSFGFATTGVRKNYYAESNEDALIMWLYHLDQPEVLAAVRRAGGSQYGSEAPVMPRAAI